MVKLKAILARILYLLGLAEKSVVTADGVIKRVTKDINELSSIAEAISIREEAIVQKQMKLSYEQNEAQAELKRAKTLQRNIENTLLKDIN